MKKKLYGAVGTQGICIYLNYQYCMMNGRKYLGKNFHIKGFYDEVSAAEWVCSEFNDLTGTFLATVEQLSTKGFNEILFKKEMNRAIGITGKF